MGSTLRLVKKDEDRLETIGDRIVYKEYGLEADENYKNFSEAIPWNGRSRTLSFRQVE